MYVYVRRSKLPVVIMHNRSDSHGPSNCCYCICACSDGYESPSEAVAHASL